jgi:fatty-acyl-CoA synthase
MAAAFPPILGIADIEALERVPLEERNDVWTVPDLVARGAALDPDKPAFEYLENGSLEDQPQAISYRQLLERARQAANLFRALGIGSRDAVAILLPIVPQNYYALLGAATAGIAFPINWMLGTGQIATLLRAARVKVLVALGPTPEFDIWEKAAALAGRIPGLKLLQVRGPGGRSEAAHDFDALSERHAGERQEFDRVIDPCDVALYVHTGGTTGMPKIAPLIHRAIAYKAWAYRVLLAQEPHHRSFAAHPLFHIGGLVHHTMGSLARGQTSIILGPMGFRSRNVIRDYWKLVERYRITDLGGVPTTLGALANVPPGDADISSLRPYTMTGSAGLPVRVSKYFAEKIGVRILSNYGMTENTATICLPPRDGDPKFGSSGIHLPYTRVRTVVLDEAGKIVRDCKADEIGEIVISGPGVISGYLDASLNAKLFVEKGWLRTGDLGRLDADSYLWVTGRAKDLIIRSGHNIDPLVIEQALMSHESVALAAAVGKPDAYAGELPVAFVQLKPGASASDEALKQYARENVPERAAAPSEVVVLEAMPLTAVGKIFKPELRDRAARRVFSEIVQSLAGADRDPVVGIEPDPVHGKLLSVTLSPLNEQDAAAEKAIRSALDRFTVQYRVRWRRSNEQ